MTPKKVLNAAGQTRWEIRISNGTGANRTFMRRRFLTEKEAKIELARIKHEQNEGVYVHRDKNMTVRKLVELWTEANAVSRKPSTARFYSDVLKPLVERHGDMPVMDLTDRHLIKLRDDMLSGAARRIGTAGEPMSARSVNAMLGAVSGLLKYGQHKRVVVHNVAVPLSVPRAKDHEAEDDERRSGWQNEHLAKFEVAVADHALCGSWMLTARGLRRGEVLGLKWSDIDWEAGEVKIMRTRTYVAGEDVIGTPKSKSSRRVLKMGADVMDALQRQRASQRFDTGWVTADVDGSPLRHEWYSDEFGRIIEAASLPAITLHGARHAAASRLASKGIPVQALAKYLGQHPSSLAVTYGYTHAQKADSDAILAAFDD